MPNAAEADANFFNLAQDALGAGEPDGAAEATDSAEAPNGNQERRESERHAYPAVQLLARYNGRDMPQPTEFRCHVCHDLSAGGFSFFCDAEPDFEQVVAALGKVPFTFVAADVVNVSQCMREGRPAYRVGCRFRCRIAGAAAQDPHYHGGGKPA